MAALAALVLSAQLAHCPPQGDAKVARVAALNILKRRMTVPQVDSAITLKAILASGDDAKRWDSHRGASIEGYIVNVKPGGIESVNCHAKAVLDRDTHIEMGLKSDVPKTERVIVEVTPQIRQTRHPEWTTAKLRQLIGKKVRITGWLFYDAEHSNASAHTCKKCVNAWRATAWEIHPVTQIEIVR
jgi:hypothetical protein